MDINSNKRFIVVTGLVSAVTLFVFLIFLTTREQSFSAKLTITAVPSVSHITINGKTGKQGVNRVRPGSQKIVVSASGFSTVTQDVSVSKGQNNPVGIVLSSDSSQTTNWYITHPADAQTAEGISSRNNDALGQQSLANAPLIKLLPFVSGGLEFRVDYGNLPGTNAGVPVIYITAPTQAGQQAGLSWIQSVGYNPSDYTIKYVTGPVTQ
jgi:PEGA domain-containing protein